MKIFEGHINGSIPVIVLFTAAWSGPAKMMEPVLHEVKELVGEKVSVITIDIDKEPALKELYNITTVPTLAVFKYGKVTWRKNGIATFHEIMEHLSLFVE